MKAPAPHTLGPLALAAGCASSGTPTSPLRFVCVPAKLGRALTLFLLSIHWDCPLSSVCQCCPRARVSVLPPGLAERCCPSTQLSWPAQKEAACREHRGSLLVTSAGQGDVPALHHGCCAPTSAPLMRALHGLSLHSGLLQPVPPARPPSHLPWSPAQQDLGCCRPCPLTRPARAEGMQHLAGGLRDDTGLARMTQRWRAAV